MDLTLTDDQREYQKLAHEFACKEIANRAANHDGCGEFARDLYQAAWNLGLVNVLTPEEWGGLNLSLADACVLAEELAAGCAGLSAALTANLLAEVPIILYGSSEQKSEFLLPLSQRLGFAARCVAEPLTGYDLGEIDCLARQVGDDYVITGKKSWVLNAGVAEWFYVLSDTQGGAGVGSTGLSAFLIPASTLGVSVGERLETMGWRAADFRNVCFEEVRVSKWHRLGQVGQGLQIELAAREFIYPLLGSSAVGLARTAMRHAVQYSGERSTFGRPIRDYQAVSFMIADMAKDIEAARFLNRRSALLTDGKLPNLAYAAMAKAFSSDVAMRVATDAVQVFGGYGYSREYPVEKLMRDAKVLQVYEGSSQIHLADIGSQLVGVK